MSMWDYLDKERMAEADPSWFDEEVIDDAWEGIDLDALNEEQAKWELIEWLTNEEKHIGCQLPFNWQCRAWLNSENQ